MVTPRTGTSRQRLGLASPPAYRFKPAVVITSFVALSLVAAVGYRVYAERTALDPNRVIIAPFQNKSGDPQLEQLGTMAADWITRGLTESGRADPVSVTPTRDAAGKFVPGELEPLALVRQARTLDAGRVVSGAVYAVGDTLQFHARITDAADGQLLISIPPAIATKSDPMAAINTTRVRVLGALAAMGPSEVVGVVSMDAPPSYAAYREFMRGEQAFSIGQYLAAIEHDRRAIAFDATYLAPLVRIAYAFHNLGQCAQTDSVGRILNAKHDQLPAYESYYLDRVLAWCQSDYNAAYNASKNMAAIAPHSSYAKYVRARSAMAINRPHEAVAALEQLDWKKPHISGYYHDLARALHKLGEHRRELEVVELYRQRLTGSLLPVEDHVRVMSALGRVDEVRRVVAASRAMSSIEEVASPATVALTASRELAAHNFPDASQRVAQDLVGWLRERAPTEENDFMMVQALFLAGQFASAYPISTRLVTAQAENAVYLSYTGLIAAAMGNRPEAERVSRALGEMQQPYLGGENIFGQAAIAARLGERARAVALLREAIRRGAIGVQIDDSDERLFSLRGYPPYDELIKPDG